jgi:serine/threonine protein kinase
MRIEERWERGRNLGTGSFGTVWLEKLVTENGEEKHRALKEIRKGVQLPKAIDYSRELEAIAKFSHQKVRESSISVLYFHFPSLRFSSCINYRKLTGENSMKCAL